MNSEQNPPPSAPEPIPPGTPPPSPGPIAGGSLGTAGLALAVAAACLMLVGLIPCLGWLNWFTLLAGFVALVLSATSWGIKVFSAKDTREIGKPIIGIVISVVALVIGGIRFIVGGGCL